MKSEALPRILPFALFMAFIGLEEAVRFLDGRGIIVIDEQHLLYLYPLKALSVFFTLLYFWKKYDEINLRDLLAPVRTALAVAIGLVVFVLWVNMDWAFATLGKPAGYDPTVLPEGLARNAAVAIRLFGAALVVPVMEELFWRSFLLRYIIDPDFIKVPIGRLTWPSFLITTLLFGLEHHFFFAGMAAGALYNFLLSRTRSIALCMLAHGITNLLLGVYVLRTSEWGFW